MPDTAPNCPLCPPTRGVVRASDHWTLVLNENQATVGRVFLALNRHETDALALTAEEQADLWALASEAKRALSTLFAPDHFNYMLLMNLTPHVHFHLFPRYAGPREFEGQTWTDPRYGDHYDPAETRPVDDATASALIAALRHEIAQPTQGGTR